MNVRRRLGAIAGAAILSTGLAVGATVALPGTADAAACTGLSGAAGSCTTVGTVTLTGGGLSMVSPPTLTWSGVLNGATQTIYDTTPADENIDVLDLRGLLSTDANSGWNVTATATTFTGATTSTTIPDPSGQVLSVGGGAAGSASNTPTSDCVTANTCTPATTNVSPFPVFVPTGSGQATIYNATAGTGTGIVQVGSSAAVPEADPMVWAVTLPPSVAADTYTSTINMTVAAGP